MIRGEVVNRRDLGGRSRKRRRESVDTLLFIITRRRPRSVRCSKERKQGGRRKTLGVTEEEHCLMINEGFQDKKRIPDTYLGPLTGGPVQEGSKQHYCSTVLISRELQGGN